MHFVWSLNSLPELAHLEPQQRRELIARCAPWGIRLRLIGLCVLLGFPGGLMPAALVIRYMASSAASPWLILGLLLSALLTGWAVVGAALFQFNMRRIRSSLR